MVIQPEGGDGNRDESIDESEEPRGRVDRVGYAKGAHHLPLSLTLLAININTLFLADTNSMDRASFSPALQAPVKPCSSTCGSPPSPHPTKPVNTTVNSYSRYTERYGKKRNGVCQPYILRRNLLHYSLRPPRKKDPAGRKVFGNIGAHSLTQAHFRPLGPVIPHPEQI